MAVPSYDEYVATLSRLTEHIDPTTPTAETAAIKTAAESLAALGPVDVITLEEWTRDNPQGVPVLGLSVGLSQEKLKNALRQHIGTAGWVTAAKERPGEIVAMLDTEFGLVAALRAQLHASAGQHRATWRSRLAVLRRRSSWPPKRSTPPARS